jgi:hypothetical protein
MPDNGTVIWLCGLHSLGFAVFHAGFWRLFGWRRSLASATFADRAVIQILNVQLIFVFVAVAAACFAWPDDLLTTRLGRALLAAMSLFWLVRLAQQAIFLRVNRPLVHALSLLFALGAALFAWPLLRQ